MTNPLTPSELVAPQTADGQLIRLRQTVYRGDFGSKGYTEHVVTQIEDTWAGWIISTRDGVSLPPFWFYSTPAAALAAAKAPAEEE